jgi:hypothetical protein
VVFVLEFVVVAPDGHRDALDFLKCRAPTVGRAAEKARSLAAGRDRQPDLSVIKDQLGAKLGEVALNASATRR